MAKNNDLPRQVSGLQLWIARIFATPLLWILGPIRVRGGYRVPREGGLLVLCNHRSDIDPVLVQWACRRPIHFMGKSELFEMRGLGRVMRSFGAFAVRRGEPDRAAIRIAVELLKDGRCVCVFPEGQLTEDGDLQEIKPGVALIARMAGVRSICAGIVGSERILPYGKLIPRPAFGGVEVNWGEPLECGQITQAGEYIAWVEGQLRSLAHPESD
ncbi:MAG: hypothetical protein AMXMBFR19_06560 [Chthonomonadaceae bacterium]|uniref:1-acyl-sn-glycerol-3-phosphate acyltransferase n=1 Tax=Candidatus Nitrosymbiomonas proteolyticus TaxID=2608984 RepID=A0A809R6K6_9BACT|nr:1-acyl-sn-glycerol-3-phosphate acyltransferase [Candidatus Nitrosymbiomonas proteolyticus]